MGDGEEEGDTVTGGGRWRGHTDPRMEDTILTTLHRIVCGGEWSFCSVL